MLLVHVYRIGLVFIVNTEENVDARHDVGVSMYRAFNYVMKHESAVKALSFLTDVRLHAHVINKSKHETIIVLFSQYKSHIIIDSLDALLAAQPTTSKH